MPHRIFEFSWIAVDVMLDTVVYAYVPPGTMTDFGTRSVTKSTNDNVEFKKRILASIL